MNERPPQYVENQPLSRLATAVPEPKNLSDICDHIPKLERSSMGVTAIELLSHFRKVERFALIYDVTSTYDHWRLLLGSVLEHPVILSHIRRLNIQNGDTSSIEDLQRRALLALGPAYGRHLRLLRYLRQRKSQTFSDYAYEAGLILFLCNESPTSAFHLQTFIIGVRDEAVRDKLASAHAIKRFPNLDALVRKANEYRTRLEAARLATKEHMRLLRYEEEDENDIALGSDDTAEHNRKKRSKRTKRK